MPKTSWIFNAKSKPGPRFPDIKRDIFPESMPSVDAARACAPNSEPTFSRSDLSPSETLDSEAFDAIEPESTVLKQACQETAEKRFTVIQGGRHHSRVDRQTLERAQSSLG